MQRKNMFWKRLWIWCLITALVFGCMEGVVVQAAMIATGSCGENCWELDSEGVLHISGEGKFATFSRDEVPWKWLRTEIKQVEFEMAKVSGGDISYYFSECTNLEKVNAIPEGVTGLNATFEGCTALVDVGQIPQTIESMCETFKNCSSLNDEMEVPVCVSVARGTFEGCVALTKSPDLQSNVLYDMTRCFYGCTKMLDAPQIPQSVRNMAYSFYQCASLKKAPILPERVEDIRYAFWNCASMTTAPDIPRFVKYMQNCLVGCTKVSGEMIIYPLITKRKNYTQFAGETAIYDVTDNPKFLGGAGTGLRVSYTNRNQEYIREYLGEGWNCGGLRGVEEQCGKLSLGDMVTAKMVDCEVETIGVETYNGKEQCPKPSVYYGYVELIEGEDFTYSYANNVDAGIATITIQGTEEFEGVIEKTFEILPRKFEYINAIGYAGVYDGNPHSIAIQCDAGAKIEYGDKEGDYHTETCPGYLLPGTYHTYYQVSKPNYVTVTGCAKVVIEPETLSVEANGYQGQYDGNPHSIQVKADDGATIRYGKEEGEYTTTVCPTYINAGKYTVYYEVAKPGYRTWRGSQDVVIERKKMTKLSFPTVAMTTPGECLKNVGFYGGETQYGKFSWENLLAITKQNEKTYPMKFVPLDLKNYDWSGLEGYREKTKDVVFDVPVFVVSYPTASSIRYGEKLENSMLTPREKGVEWSWEKPEIMPKESGYYNVVLKAGEEQLTRQLWLEVKKAIPLCDTPQIEEVLYDGEGMLKDVELPQGWSWCYPEQIPCVESQGYEATFIPSDTEHYEIIYRVIPLKVQRKEVETEHPDEFILPENESVGEITVKKEESLSQDSSSQTISQPSSKESIESEKKIKEDVSYDKKITQWIREIDQAEKTSSQVKISAIKRKGKKIIIKWKKIKNATRYQVKCVPKNKQKKRAATRYKKTCSATLSLKKSVKYKVKVRAVFRENGKTVYGKWSKRKTI